jgi:hypothetical protein
MILRRIVWSNSRYDLVAKTTVTAMSESVNSTAVADSVGLRLLRQRVTVNASAIAEDRQCSSSAKG